MKNNNHVLVRIRESFLNSLSYSLRSAKDSTENSGSFNLNFVSSIKCIQKQIVFVFLFMLLSYSFVFANNITIGTNSVALTGKDISGATHFTLVQFDLTWDNSWRTLSAIDYTSSPGAASSGTTITVTSTTGLRVGMSVSVTAGTGVFAAGTVVTVINGNGTTFTVSAAPGTALSGGASVVTGVDVKNYDAAWVFVKYRVLASSGGDGLWHHASLNDAGHTAPSGSTIDIGLLTPATAFNTTTNPGLGAFIYRSADGSAVTNTFTGVQLRWNYGVNYKTGSTPIGDNDIVDIEVFAIEMVYVPTGTFALGSGGSETSHFYTYPTTTTTYSVSTEAAITVGTTSGNLYYGPGTYAGDQEGPIPLEFPKGYNAFYCMKYEISQQGYVDFLNTLTYTQQDTRTYSGTPSSPAGWGAFGNSNRNGIDIQTPGVNSTTPAVYACNLNGNTSYGESDDGQSTACNLLSWPDIAAYLDWSGLRPMTELEYEKACRGTLPPVANEYAWGTTGIASSTYTLSNSGATDEVIGSNYSTTVGNALYYSTYSSINGALRVGIFAGTTGNTGRVTAGATYYGIMEMSGNLWDFSVSAGNVTGRLFNGANGNGLLDVAGDANVTYWPGTDGVGAGNRGGAAPQFNYQLTVSNRELSLGIGNSRSSYTGGRGVRGAPVITYSIGQSYGGGIIFYIDGTGQHGLISATSDQSIGAEWGCYGTPISGADGTAIGTGNQNTIDIMAGCLTAGIAARLCGDLVLGGYSDWYLPSKDELYQMYVKQNEIGGFASDYYWCSTETIANTAGAYLFSSGEFGGDMAKGNLLHVRAIRHF